MVGNLIFGDFTVTISIYGGFGQKDLRRPDGSLCAGHGFI
jgi:hypothetical protein